MCIPIKKNIFLHNHSITNTFRKFYCHTIFYNLILNPYYNFINSLSDNQYKYFSFLSSRGSNSRSIIAFGCHAFLNFHVEQFFSLFFMTLTLWRSTGNYFTLYPLIWVSPWTSLVGILWNLCPLQKTLRGTFAPHWWCSFWSFS